MRRGNDHHRLYLGGRDSWVCFSNKKIEVYTPQAGDTLSCNFAITDISYPCPGTEYIPQLAWTGTQKINKTPSEWGSVTLAD